MGEAFQLAKAPGLMRRLSNRANRLRRRQSSNNMVNRDHSSGPEIMRRRSGSKTSTDLDSGSPDVELEGYDEEVFDEPISMNALGLSTDGVLPSGATSPRRPHQTEGGIAPIVSPRLRAGTQLLKVSKKKKKNLVFVLDTESARVSWHPSSPSKRFYIDDIQQIRLQGDARNYREEFQITAESESRWFTIIYADPDRAKGRPVKSMHLIAPDAATFELWTSTLEDLSQYRHELMKGLAGSGQDEKTLQGHWKREMAKRFQNKPHPEQAEKLDLPGVEALCRSLHIHCSKTLLAQKFHKADARQTGHLNFEEFKNFVRLLKERHDVKEIFQKLTANSPSGLDLEGFLDFLQQVQDIDARANLAHWQKIFTKCIRKVQSRSSAPSTGTEEQPLYMNSEAFSSFLSSGCNSVLMTKPTEVKLDRPLNEYFISSSHNTYLLGRQLAGSSSTEAYIRALQRACRCVEIDCWDGPDGRPIVSHGRTMTTSVLFADCISVIAKYAFEESPYPLILSLEVHCNAAQQQVMVDIMIRELGDRLVTEPFMTNVFILPSPEDLKNRILIKVKAGNEPIDRDGTMDGTVGNRQRSMSSPFARPQFLDNSIIPNSPIFPTPPSTSPPDQPPPPWGNSRGSTTATSMSSATEDSDIGQSGSLKPRRKATRKKGKIIPPLGALGVYTRGLKFDDFNHPDSKAYNHVFSLAEKTFENLCREADPKSQLEKHNRRYLMRVYPSAFRMKSTNPDPLTFWKRGVQMVALNWQTYDLGMQMNEAMFASGPDRTGYVLKPRELRQQQSSIPPSFLADHPPPPPSSSSLLDHASASTLPKTLLTFSLTILSAQQLPRPRNFSPDESLSPYVELELFSPEAKAGPLRRRTAIVPNNGYNPAFGDAFRLVLETEYPDLVFVRWTVWHSVDGKAYLGNGGAGGSSAGSGVEPLASFAAKLGGLGTGLRHLPLFDANGDQFLFSTLFVRVEVGREVREGEREGEKDAGGVGMGEKVGRLGRLGGVFRRTISVERKREE